MTTDELFEDDVLELRSTSMEIGGGLTVRERMEAPEVLRALVRGEPMRRVAKMAGVSLGTVSRWMRKLPMERLLEIESKRVVHHLSKRNLGKEKYLALVTALGQMIDKARLLNEEPTEIIGTRDLGRFDRIQESIEREQIELRRREREGEVVYEPAGAIEREDLEGLDP